MSYWMKYISEKSICIENKNTFNEEYYFIDDMWKNWSQFLCVKI